jgi:hypothetical protein
VPADYTTFDEIGRRFNIHRGLFRKFDNAVRTLGEDNVQPGTGRRGLLTLKFAKQSDGRISFALAGTEFVIQHEFHCSTATRASSIVLYQKTSIGEPELVHLHGIKIDLTEGGEILATGGGFGNGKVDNQEVCEKAFFALLSNIEKATKG